VQDPGHRPAQTLVQDHIHRHNLVEKDKPSQCGKFQTKALIEGWNDDAWHLANPEHPFACIKCALLNRQRLVDKVKQHVPLACVKRRGKIAFIPLDASPATEDLFLKYL
jgi:hypothetical protein